MSHWWRTGRLGLCLNACSSPPLSRDASTRVYVVRGSWVHRFFRSAGTCVRVLRSYITVSYSLTFSPEGWRLPACDGTAGGLSTAFFLESLSLNGHCFP